LPEFVLGCVVASLISYSQVASAVGEMATKTVGNAAKVYRNWMFALCFVSIGLETNFKELVSVGGGRPAIA
jgi:uncharacterized membrane protein YadS